VVVGQLLPIVRRLADDGVTVVLVEQSVNVALTVAERAYFMERGTIMFDGPTAELLERPDLLRSVFLSAAQPGPGSNGDGGDGAGSSTERLDVDRTASPVLTVSELTVSFGGLRAVSGTSFDVWPREIVGIIGPNGAGKTTVFDLISGFTPLDSGHIVLNGRNVTSLGPAERAAMGLGRSFQDARLFPELTVDETLAIAQERFVASRSAIVAAFHLPMVVDSEHHVALRVDELLELMGLGEYRHLFVRELSTGTRRVVDLACLVAHRPAVILLDEPTSGIAQREVEALAPVIRRLRDEMGASLVIVEHDIPFVSEVSDRLLALEQGQVIAAGPPADVLAHPDVIESYLGTSGAAIARSGGTE
jgi:branched-chain amino acid transport system ATP-binding protein